MSASRSRRDRGSDFDLDLLDGQASEDALARTICWSRFEVKADHKAERTGRHAVEVERLRHDSKVDPETLPGLSDAELRRLRASGDLEPSGITVTKAQWWAIEYRRSQRRWLIIHVDDVKKLAVRAGRQGLVAWGGAGKRTRLVLVPLSWLVEVER